MSFVLRNLAISQKNEYHIKNIFITKLIVITFRNTARKTYENDSRRKGSISRKDQTRKTSRKDDEEGGTEKSTGGREAEA